MFLEKKIQSATKILRDHNISSSLLDAEIIISDILGIERKSLITSGQIAINDKIIDEAKGILDVERVITSIFLVEDLRIQKN